MLYDSFWKRQNHGDSEMTLVVRDVQEEGVEVGNWQSTEDFYNSTCHCAFVKTHSVYFTKSVLQCTPWILGVNDVS